MVGPDPAVAALRNAVRSMLHDPQGPDRDQGDLILVACSGGPDSLALAAALAFVAPRLGLRAGAVVGNHGLQAGAASTASAAAAACRDLGLDPVIVETVTVDSAGGVEGAARKARYEALESVAGQVGGRVVLLGHTRDDQAETVLLRLARGSGARSLAAMAPWRGIFGRPLLGVARAVTHRACEAEGLVPWHDPGNAAHGPLRRADGQPLPRAAVREQVLPALRQALGQDVSPALARTAELLRQDADLLEELAEDLLRRALEGSDQVESAVRAPDDLPTHPMVEVLAAAPPALRRRALQSWLGGEGAGDLSQTHLESVDALVTAWHGQAGADVPGGLRVRRVAGRLVASPRGQVALMCGPAGSGKSTHARELARQGWRVLVFDEIAWQAGHRDHPLAPEVAESVHAEILTTLRSLVPQGVDVVVDTSFWSRASRQRYRDALTSLGVVPVIHYLATPREVALSRVAARDGSASDQVQLSPEMAAAYFDGFEIPTASEGPLVVIT